MTPKVTSANTWLLAKHHCGMQLSRKEKKVCQLPSGWFEGPGFPKPTRSSSFSLFTSLTPLTALSGARGAAVPQRQWGQQLAQSAGWVWLRFQSQSYVSLGYIWMDSEDWAGPGHTFSIETDANFTSFWGEQGALGILVFAGL